MTANSLILNTFYWQFGISRSEVVRQVAQTVSTLPSQARLYVDNPQLIQETAMRNSTLQGAYMMFAARALGLDCGPMSGFDHAKLDEEFFAAGTCDSCEQEFFPEGHVKSNFLCNIDYGDPAKLTRRALGSTLARYAPRCDSALLPAAT